MIFLAGYLRRRAASFLLLFLLVTAGGACAIAVQYGMKRIVDAMAGEGATGAPWVWLVRFLALIAVESVLWRVAGWLGCRTIVGTGVDIRLDLFRHLSGQPMRFFSDQLSGALGGRITATAGSTGAVLGALTWQILPPIVDFVGAVVLFTAIDVRMAGALVAFVTLVSTAVTVLGVRGRGWQHAYAEDAARVNGELVDVVSNMWTVKAFSARQREHDRLRAAFGDEAAAQRRSWMYLEKVRVLHDVLLWGMSGAMLVWAVRAWDLDRITAGDVLLVTALTFRLLHGSRDLALALVNVSNQVAVIRELLGVIGRPHQVADVPFARPFVPRRGSIRMDRVRYGYEEGKPILVDFHLSIAGGERIGVVGPSGAGKSTLVALLQRLDDVQEGGIWIDDQPIGELTQDTLRAAIAVVPQEVALFHRSVLDNIRYGKPQATDQQVRAAAHAAHCAEFVDALANGYDTVVGERGTRLSGGQRQRIGIARAFLKDAPILVLDEATSSLDIHSEAEIQLALGRLMRGRTVIAVAHRLATVSAFDRVIVIENGRIVEDGPPVELRRRGGPFAAMWQLQADGFSLEDMVSAAG